MKKNDYLPDQYQQYSILIKNRSKAADEVADIYRNDCDGKNKLL